MSARARSFDRAFGEIEWEEHDPDWGCCPSQIFPATEGEYRPVRLPLDHEFLRREPLSNPFDYPGSRFLAYFELGVASIEADLLP